MHIIPIDEPSDIDFNDILTAGEPWRTKTPPPWLVQKLSRTQKVFPTCPGRWMTDCPACGNPGMGIWERPVLRACRTYCPNGCTPVEIAAAVGALVDDFGILTEDGEA